MHMGLILVNIPKYLCQHVWWYDWMNGIWNLWEFHITTIPPPLLSQSHSLFFFISVFLCIALPLLVFTIPLILSLHSCHTIYYSLFTHSFPNTSIFRSVSQLTFPTIFISVYILQSIPSSLVLSVPLSPFSSVPSNSLFTSFSLLYYFFLSLLTHLCQSTLCLFLYISVSLTISSLFSSSFSITPFPSVVDDDHHVSIGGSISRQIGRLATAIAMPTTTITTSTKTTTLTSTVTSSTTATSRASTVRTAAAT